jgi:seryl-tRNA synthetase
MKINQVQDIIKDKKKADKTAECKLELAEKNKLEAELKLILAEKDRLDEEFDKKYTRVGNIVHDSVPVFNDEEKNTIYSTWGEPNRVKIDGTPGKAHHHQILWWLGGYDPEAGSKVAGHKGYFLKGPGVLLNQALTQYGLRFLANRKYEPIQPPYFMKKDVMAKTAQLSDFDDQLYK